MTFITFINHEANKVELVDGVICYTKFNQTMTQIAALHRTSLERNTSKI